ncbi:Fibronectin type III domain [Dehalogenimonas alkenigignens]|uniref:Fibronectin type III domain n=1 Tax=Dehalogenimonas alkenigignens TaxID=1217799 RepID=A0A0W0GGA6_9CHLR|nr:fibronectin type III domain-containing protein [Dehalogenimonas alkenigignens]KTB47567.1 Fibronectin type III domain [Dehalogenimonas alkenigignens]
MKKLNKIFSVVLTVAIAASMLIAAVPVSAADNAWSAVSVPAHTGEVMPNDYLQTGFMTMGIDGTLYAYAQVNHSSNQYKLIKSTNGGRSWTMANLPDQTQAATAVFCSPNEANVVYVAQGATLYKSTDSGATFANRGTAAGTITAIGAALAGGSYKVFIGTGNGVFYQNEGELFPVFDATAFLNTAGFNVQALKLSPNFATDLGIIVIKKAAGAAPIASFSVNGFGFNTTLKDVQIVAATDNTVVSIDFPSDFNMSTAPFFYAGLNGTNGGVYRVMGNASTPSILQLPFFGTAQPVVSIDVLGTFSGATIFAGTSNGKAFLSTDGGANFTAAKKLTPFAGMTMVALKSDFATSGVAYALQGGMGLAQNDQSGFSLSVDQAKNFSAVSLLNDSFSAINDMAATSTVTWLATSRATAGVGSSPAGSFTATGNTTSTAIAADKLTITNGHATDGLTATFNVATGSVSAAINAGSSAGAAIVGNVIFLGAGDSATLTATAAGTSGSIDIQGLGAGSVVLAVVEDLLGTANAIVVPPAVLPGVGSFSLPDAASATPGVVAGSIAITLTAGAVTVTGAATGNGTYTFGVDAFPVNVTMDTANPTATITQTGAVAAAGTFALTTATASTTSPISLAAAVTAGTTVYANSLWRKTGDNWERVYFSGTDAAAINMLRLSPNYATDQTVVFTTKGTNNKIMVSNNNGTLFTAQLVAPGGATPVVANTLIVLDKNVYVVGGNSGVVTKTLDNGFTWTNVTIAAPTGGTTGNITSMARSSDGTALVVGTDQGRLSKSTDLGATWTTSTAALTGATSLMVAFRTGSNDVVWATEATGGLFSYDFAATTPAWSSRQDDGVALFDSAAGNLLTAPVGLASGTAAGTAWVTYGLNANGSVVRLLSSASKAGLIAPSSDFSSASALFANGNTLTVVSGAKMFTYTDTLAVAVAGVTVGAFTTSQATVSWTALTGVDRFAVAIVQSSTAARDLYSATLATSSQSGTSYTITGLAANTTYTVRVWGVRTSDDAHLATATFAGTFTFSTQPNVPTTPSNLAPAAGASNVPTMPTFQWAAVTGATSYELEVSTASSFSPLTGTKITTSIPAAAWTGTALANNTTYYWRVRAITGTGTSDWVISVFTTAAATPTSPPVTIPTSPVVTPTVTVVIPDTETPTYIWAIIGVGALLTVLVIVLIVRTRRVV